MLQLGRSMEVEPGASGYQLSKANVFAQFSTEIVAGKGWRVLLASHFEAFDPAWLSREGVRRLISVADECEPPASVRAMYPEGSIQWIALKDSVYTELPVQTVAAFLDDAVKSNETVLIHCREGRNRSAALLIAWLMSSNVLQDQGGADAPRLSTLKAALEFVVQKRPLVDPNIGFLIQLLALERSLSRGIASEGMLRRGCTSASKQLASACRPLSRISIQTVAGRRRMESVGLVRRRAVSLTSPRPFPHTPSFSLPLPPPSPSYVLPLPHTYPLHTHTHAHIYLTHAQARRLSRILQV